MEVGSKLRGTNIELTILVFFIILEIFWRLQNNEYLEIPYLWIFRGVYFITVGWFGVKQFSSKSMDVAIVGVYRGALLGFVIGLFELIWYHNVNAFIFLLAFPWQTMVVGFIVSGMTAYIVSLWKQEKRDYFKS